MRQTYFTTILCVFLAGVFKVKSQTEHSIGSYTMSDSERCVCQPHVTINPPVCGRSVPVNSGTSCNSTTVQEILRTVSANQDTVSSELGETRRKVDELQVTVSSNQEVVTTELRNTTQQLEELQVEVYDMKQQLIQLQVAVSTVVNLILTSSIIPKDCSEIRARGVSMSDVYTVQPLDSGEAFHVYCDMETDGGGWTVFQRRQDGSVDFYLDFSNYSRGFGDLEGEFWLGNDNLHRLTAQGEYELRVDLSDFEDSTAYAVYDSFSIADESDNYRLTLGRYSGTAGNSLGIHNSYQFSTKDRDNDVYNGNCAEEFHGAWWYIGCHYSALNGEYLRGTTIPFAQGVYWHGWKGYHYSLKTSEMKIRTTP